MCCPRGCSAGTHVSAAEHLLDTLHEAPAAQPHLVVSDQEHLLVPGPQALVCSSGSQVQPHIQLHRGCICADAPKGTVMGVLMVVDTVNAEAAATSTASTAALQRTCAAQTLNRSGGISSARLTLIPQRARSCLPAAAD